ncbi:hypothetical protein [Glutamicibacter sp. NPDC087344]|uniref:hypothetical protein n=1 Tax=Glutamicibacter sp. NPDC087344 TaxID=3363994 RepID=UPI0038155A0A
MLPPVGVYLGFTGLRQLAPPSQGGGLAKFRMVRSAQVYADNERPFATILYAKTTGTPGSSHLA